MKKLLFLLTLLLAAPVAYAQQAAAPALPLDPATHLVTYSGVVNVPGATRGELYARASAWAASRYKADGDALQVQDKVKSKIVVKGYTKALVNGRDCGPVGHMLSISIKEGVYQYEVTNFANTHPTPAGEYGMGPFENEKPHLALAYADDITNALVQKNWNALRSNTDADVKTMLAYLQVAMTNATQDKSEF